MNACPFAQRWIRIALVYFLTAVALGVVMAASHDFRLRGLHVHLNLLGWVSMALTGAVYHLFPAAAQSRAARLHFWLYNLSLPVMMASLAGVLLGHPSAEPVVAISSIAVLCAVAIFVLTVLLQRSGTSAATAASPAALPSARSA
ncbi:MAG TPA: hypothetical protein VFP68_14995 [Burkholderiaceae bacterium]|nr:hypothetical protein [Burkholderiaceae bacterium]